MKKIKKKSKNFNSAWKLSVAIDSKKIIKKNLAYDSILISIYKVVIAWETNIKLNWKEKSKKSWIKLSIHQTTTT